MPRRPRTHLDNVPLHIVQRGHNRAPCFFAEQDYRTYPSTELGLSALMSMPAGNGRWQGPYLKKAVPLDPWGNAYVYKSPGDHADFDILSYGHDGKAGGLEEDADIGNW